MTSESPAGSGINISWRFPKVPFAPRAANSVARAVKIREVINAHRPGGATHFSPQLQINERFHHVNAPYGLDFPDLLQMLRAGVVTFIPFNHQLHI